MFIKPREAELWTRMPGLKWVMASKENFPEGYKIV
jgi:hypothetical protein